MPLTFTRFSVFTALVATAILSSSNTPTHFVVADDKPTTGRPAFFYGPNCQQESVFLACDALAPNECCAASGVKFKSYAVLSSQNNETLAYADLFYSAFNTNTCSGTACVGKSVGCIGNHGPYISGNWGFGTPPATVDVAQSVCKVANIIGWVCKETGKYVSFTLPQDDNQKTVLLDAAEKGNIAALQHYAETATLPKV